MLSTQRVGCSVVMVPVGRVYLTDTFTIVEKITAQVRVRQQRRDEKQ